jgi:hypothetical protein
MHIREANDLSSFISVGGRERHRFSTWSELQYVMGAHRERELARSSAASNSSENGAGSKVRSSNPEDRERRSVPESGTSTSYSSEGQGPTRPSSSSSLRPGRWELERDR